ncbi:MAG TPA: hypothetical protein VIM65_06425 [Cyclobacteriaceae bacterium]
MQSAERKKAKSLSLFYTKSYQGFPQIDALNLFNVAFMITFEQITAIWFGTRLKGFREFQGTWFTEKP